MTTRDQAHRRIVERGGDAGRQPVDALRPPTLPERLLAAREEKGVDLYRAERDTKIRARYLAALERGDWRELPGSVYTKGFLRNYALYLGLDPDDILIQWRAERGDNPPTEPVIVVPHAVAAPRQGFTFSPGMLAAALLVIGVVAFAAYLAVQLLRFAKPPSISVTDPSSAVSEVDESTTSYTLRGTSQAGASIVITTPGRDVQRVNAGPDGTWSADIDLRRGRNEFDVTATDPDTGKSADAPVHLFITVPYSVVQAPTLTVDQPADGATFENGAIPVQGRATNAKTATISATYLGPVPGGGQAGAAPNASPTIAPSATKRPRASVAPAATPRPPAAPVPQIVPVTEDGSFNAAIELTAGRWAITVTAASAQGRTTTITRSVAVSFKGVNLVLTVTDGPIWLKVWVDGKVDPGLGQTGRTVETGKTMIFSGTGTVEVRTGNSGGTRFTLNGTVLGALGKPGVAETWMFEPPNPPVRTDHQ